LIGFDLVLEDEKAAKGAWERLLAIEVFKVSHAFVANIVLVSANLHGPSFKNVKFLIANIT
jgi:hypothetical protein